MISMLHKVPLAMAVAASLALPVIAFAGDAPASAPKPAPKSASKAAPNKRHVIYHWHGYGFLPGYHQPPALGVPDYGPRRSASSRRSPAWDAPDYTPHYWYDGGKYYFGEPGFLHGRYNGGSVGPCWTSTPIGLMWNCG
jgi:hypothetical protein